MLAIRYSWYIDQIIVFISVRNNNETGDIIRLGYPCIMSIILTY